MKKILLLLFGFLNSQFIYSQSTLYVLTEQGGSANLGAISKYDISTNQLTAVYSFSGSDGSFGDGSLIKATDGKLYGMARGGGDPTLNGGVIFFFRAHHKHLFGSLQIQ